jgi:hypothetical protein
MTPIQRLIPAWLLLLGLTVLGPSICGGAALVIAGAKFLVILWMFMGTRRAHLAWSLVPGAIAALTLALSHLARA